MADAPASILIVDDDESMLELCEVGVRRAGYQVKTCCSGDQALKLLESQAFDLVLSDMQMPGNTDGHAVVVAVKARHPATEVVIMTAAPSLQTAIETLKDGAYDYVIKPFHVDHLLVVLRRCLDHRRLRHDLISEQSMRRELESAYKELQKMEQLKESFLARISHELKTPLSEMLMALYLLEEALHKASPEIQNAQISKCLTMLKMGGNRLEKTLSNLVNFVDIQKKPVLETSVPVDLESLCKETAQRLKPLWEPRRLAVHIAFEPGTPSIQGDPALLAKAIEHLLHNAILFNRDNGSVAIRCKERQERVELTVADTGEGIPESEFSNIFESFYQIANYLTRKVDGLGLGLSITRLIVEAHHGEITVSSKVGEGTTFTVLLPTAAKP